MKDAHTLNRAQHVAVPNTGVVRRSSGVDLESDNTLGAIHPDSVVRWKPELLVLLIIHPGRNRSRDGEDRQKSGRELESEFLKHRTTLSGTVSKNTATTSLYVQFGCQPIVLDDNRRH